MSSCAGQSSRSSSLPIGSYDQPILSSSERTLTTLRSTFNGSPYLKVIARTVELVKELIVEFLPRLVGFEQTALIFGGTSFQCSSHITFGDWSSTLHS